MKKIVCPECKGGGTLIKQWGYCPTLYTEEEQIDCLRQCSDIAIDSYKILGRSDTMWKVECPTCQGYGVVYITILKEV